MVEDLLRYGRQHGFGLEAGSKPELLAAMALIEDDHTPLICNGFKDAQFIEAVILARKIGKNVIPVVEKFSELHLIITQAKKHDVRPRHRRAGQARQRRVGPVGGLGRGTQQVRPVRQRGARRG